MLHSVQYHMMFGCIIVWNTDPISVSVTWDGLKKFKYYENDDIQHQYQNQSVTDLFNMHHQLKPIPRTIKHLRLHKHF